MRNHASACFDDASGHVDAIRTESVQAPLDGPNRLDRQRCDELALASGRAGLGNTGHDSDCWPVSGRLAFALL